MDEEDDKEDDHQQSVGGVDHDESEEKAGANNLSRLRLLVNSIDAATNLVSTHTLKKPPPKKFMQLLDIVPFVRYKLNCICAHKKLLFSNYKRWKHA